MTSATALHHPSTSSADSSLVTELYELVQKSKKRRPLVKTSNYNVDNVTITSWKMDEFKYYDVPSPFPSLVRGLFTTKPGEGENKDKERYRIVVRGYDKFFNIGEVPWTTWNAISQNTSPPYTLTLKSNGCIIFIGALTPTKLVVTSKHSLGHLEQTNTDSGMSHAEKGEEWLRKCLQSKGKTEADLASKLWNENWTAVAELCDDSFEEHVLPYPPHLTGLHLHGLNSCTRAFNTFPQSVVDAFAKEWGFIGTLSKEVGSIEEVQKFSEEAAKKGEWNGQAVEGFVVRCHIKGESTTMTNSGAGETTISVAQSDGRVKRQKAPYPPGSTFFFKIKFDEPYMMYRDWREVTKSLLTTLSKSPKAHPPTARALQQSVSKNKMRRAETKEYVKWIIPQMLESPQLFESFRKGKGIIGTRIRFLEWVEEERKQGRLRWWGSDEIPPEEDTKDNEEAQGGEAREKDFKGKVVIVPIAVPGCGKTAVAVALQHIFGWGHTQSDDVKAKKPAPLFLKNVVQLLKKHDIVIADKNNHLRLHRETLRETVNKAFPNHPNNFIALYWNIHNPNHTQGSVHSICSSRILSRGSNHQSLIPQDEDAKHHENVLWKFITGTEDLGDGEVDEVIEMDVADDLEVMIRRAVRELVELLGDSGLGLVAEPTEEKVAEALKIATEYKPKTVASQLPSAGKKKKHKPRYYAFVPLALDLQTTLAPYCDANGSYNKEHPDGIALWTHMKSHKRITGSPHITITHTQNLANEQDAWDLCADFLSQHEDNQLQFQVAAGNLIWNEDIMALSIDSISPSPTLSSPLLDKAQKFLDSLPQNVVDRLHITVGTRSSGIKPIEAKAMVERWRNGIFLDDKGEKAQVQPLNSIMLTCSVFGLT